MERPTWVPETHISREEACNDLVCVCYHFVLRACAPEASTDDHMVLPAVLDALLTLLGLK